MSGNAMTEDFDHMRAVADQTAPGFGQRLLRFLRLPGNRRHSAPLPVSAHILRDIGMDVIEAEDLQFVASLDRPMTRNEAHNQGIEALTCAKRVVQLAIQTVAQPAPVPSVSRPAPVAARGLTHRRPGAILAQPE